MKKTISFGATLLMLIFIIGSCATSNDVASNKFIQKRKYLRGYHISSKQSLFKKSKPKNHSEDFLVMDDLRNAPTIINGEKYNHHFNITEEEEESHAILALSEEKTSKKKIKNVTSERPPLESTDLGLSAPKKSKIQNIYKRPIRKNLKELKSNADSNLELLILVILALILPPLAVYLYEGVTTRFWIDLVLALIGIGVGSILFGAGLIYLGALLAVIYALLIVLELI